MKIINTEHGSRVEMDPETEARRDACTKRVWMRIAELKIQHYKLECTPEEYLAECKRRNQK